MALNDGTVRTVFIAEDNPILLEGLERALTAHGYDVATAADGPSMIELLKLEALPDVLLLDVMMPGLSGVQVLDAVRSEPRTAALPVILITAAAEGVVSEADLGAKGVVLLMKPFRLTELLSQIENCVQTAGSRPSGSAEGEASSVPAGS